VYSVIGIGQYPGCIVLQLTMNGKLKLQVRPRLDDVRVVDNTLLREKDLDAKQTSYAKVKQATPRPVGPSKLIFLASLQYIMTFISVKGNSNSTHTLKTTSH
jgi:hypothetical protein